mmetsp:Transcript_10537/g.26277  ORF Transcript_10537/g.26277 Transcript_10537/m.26277 type:complete len:316 (-) Transcript_10537:133-1080(-)
MSIRRPRRGSRVLRPEGTAVRLRGRVESGYGHGRGSGGRRRGAAAPGARGRAALLRGAAVAGRWWPACGAADFVGFRQHVFGGREHSAQGAGLGGAGGEVHAGHAGPREGAIGVLPRVVPAHLPASSAGRGRHPGREERGAWADVPGDAGLALQRRVAGDGDRSVVERHEKQQRVQNHRREGRRHSGNDHGDATLPEACESPGARHRGAHQLVRHHRPLPDLCQDRWRGRDHRGAEPFHPGRQHRRARLHRFVHVLRRHASAGAGLQVWSATHCQDLEQICQQPRRPALGRRAPQGAVARGLDPSCAHRRLSGGG